MSEANEAVDTSACCASCGIAEIDDVKLVPCDDCDLVKYCNDDCREEHRSEHEEQCKKRAAELREELLFKQPDSNHLGDCPICCLPLSIYADNSITYECCSKVICKGCASSIYSRDSEAPSCPFCRSIAGKSKKESDKLRMKRVKANDPVALYLQGGKEYDKGYYSRAFRYFTKAADLGYAQAHFRLAMLYHEGQGVEKDKKKEIHHCEEAAIGGHPNARVCLGEHEYSNDNLDRAVKHWIIGATQGCDASIKMLMMGFKMGFVEKDDLDSAFRAQKAAVDATKSPQREAEEKLMSKSNESERQKIAEIEENLKSMIRDTPWSEGR